MFPLTIPDDVNFILNVRARTQSLLDLQQESLEDMGNGKRKRGQKGKEEGEESEMWRK